MQFVKFPLLSFHSMHLPLAWEDLPWVLVNELLHEVSPG